MKKLTTIILMVHTYLSFAFTYYLDATNGDDLNMGTTKSNAWKSIAKVNLMKLAAGDSVLFKRGEIFRGNLIALSGKPNQFITYGAYGSGVKPKILGSINRTSEFDWIDEGNNIWRLNELLTGYNDIGNIIFNNESYCGVKVFKAVDMTVQNEFYYDPNDDTLRLYSNSNPGRFYMNVELAVKIHIIDLDNVNYANFSNLDLRYGAAHGMQGANASFITIQDCDFSYIGGGKFGANPVGRYGNGVEFWHDTRDMIVERCTFDNIYDAAITPQGREDEESYVYYQYNMYFRNNIISNTEYSYEFFGWDQADIHDIYFENNICINAGGGWGHNQRHDPNGTHVMIWELPASCLNSVVRNNIFSNSSNYGIRWQSEIHVNSIVVDNNCWYESSGSIARISDTYYDYATEIENYKAETGQDINSEFSNPLLKLDFTLSDKSRCKNAGKKEYSK